MTRGRRSDTERRALSRQVPRPRRLQRWALAALVVLVTLSALSASVYGRAVATGWGTYKPNEVFNGGDLSGHVVAITWKHWGSPAATGTGATYIFKPEGGYYPRSVTVALRPFDLGHCGTDGPRAYEHLDVWVASPPGGRFGKWTAWSASICTATSMGTSTTTGPEAQPCHEGQISVSSGGGGAGLGHEDQIIAFTNRSQATCVLSGYPGVAALNAQGQRAVQAERTPNGYMGRTR